jgi:hypothetical protein
MVAYVCIACSLMLFFLSFSSYVLSSRYMGNHVLLQVKVIFCPPEPVKKATIREIYSGIKEENLSRLILVLQGKILSQARESIKDIFSFKVDVFQVRFM